MGLPRRLRQPEQSLLDECSFNPAGPSHLLSRIVVTDHAHRIRESGKYGETRNDYLPSEIVGDGGTVF